VEPFSSKSGSDSFGAKVAHHFERRIRVLLTHLFDPNLKVISQPYILNNVHTLIKLKLNIQMLCSAVV